MASSPSVITEVSVGSRAPEFEISDAAALHDFLGQSIVLAFFPNDWDPGRAHQLALYNRTFADLTSGEQVVGISVEGGLYEVTTREEGTVRFQVLRGLADRPDVAALYGVEGRQALFVVNPDGLIAWRHVSDNGGFPPADELRRAISGEVDKKLSRREFLVVAAAVSLAATLVSRVGAAEPARQQIPNGTPQKIRLEVNGKRHEFLADSRTTLLDALRERIGLTGTKKGCDHGQCGACTVHVDGRRVNSCLTLAMQVEGAQVTTIEGLSRGDKLHPVQAAFIKHDGYQCGYCTPGQVMSAVACIHEGHAGSSEEIKEWMSGNICRCGAYVGICEAVAEANGAMGGNK